MTEQEIKDLACQYVEEVYNSDTDFIDEAVSIIGWLLLDHCIVSREKLKKHDIAHRANSNSWVMLSKKDISDIFGSDLFEKGGGK